MWLLSSWTNLRVTASSMICFTWKAEAAGGGRGDPNATWGAATPEGCVAPSEPSQAGWGVWLTAFLPHLLTVSSVSLRPAAPELHTSHFTELFFWVLSMGGVSFQVSHEMSSPSWTPLSETALPHCKTPSTPCYSSFWVLTLSLSYVFLTASLP